MREASISTRFVTIPGNYSAFKNSFEALIEQLMDAGITNVYCQSHPKYRLWIKVPRRQVIFVSQSNIRDVNRCHGAFISISQIEKFLKTGGS